MNDAPALATADVGIAIGAGTDVAVATADVVLVRSDPEDVVTIIALARATYGKMVQNLAWATGYNVIAIPLAAGVLAGVGIVLSPAIGGVLMSASTIIVAINARTLKEKGAEEKRPGFDDTSGPPSNPGCFWPPTEGGARLRGRRGSLPARGGRPGTHSPRGKKTLPENPDDPPPPGGCIPSRVRQEREKKPPKTSAPNRGPALARPPACRAPPPPQAPSPPPPTCPHRFEASPATRAPRPGPPSTTPHPPGRGLVAFSSIRSR